MPVPEGATIVFYDGLCGLCNRLNRFILKRDRNRDIWFAPLQSSFARDVLPRHNKNPEDLDSVYVLVGYYTRKEVVYSRSEAVLVVLESLNWFWKRMAFVMRMVPTPLRNFVYKLVSKSRYRVFGVYQSCPVPPPEWRGQFVELCN